MLYATEMTHPLDKQTPKYPEWQLQAYVSTQLHRLGILHHGDQNAGRRGPKAAAQAKATGMLAGWPDLVVVLPVPRYGLPHSRTVYIEYKTASGTVSAVQKALHARMAVLGLEVHVIHARLPQEAWVKTQAALGLHGGKPE